MKSLLSALVFLGISFLLVSCKKENETIPAKGWQNVAAMPTARYNFGFVECNDLLYAIGGYNTDGLNTVEMYDPAANTWQSKAAMPTARGYLVVASVLGKIYAIGGISGPDLNNITYIHATEEYDPATNSWVAKSPVPLPAAFNSVLGNLFITGAAINGKIYVGVGSSEGNMTLVYEPATDTWSNSAKEIPKFNFEPYFAASTGNDMYVDNGDDFIKYMANADAWNQLQPFSTSIKGSCLAADANNLYSIGGYSVEYENNEYNIYTQDTVRVYNISSSTWSVVTSLNSKRHSAAALEYNGNLYVTGGAEKQPNFSDVPLSTTEVLSLK
jgi:N-acetylneuraminic acid mutarotase